jgi:hypothetical protein
MHTLGAVQSPVLRQPATRRRLRSVALASEAALLGMLALPAFGIPAIQTPAQAVPAHKPGSRPAHAKAKPSPAEPVAQAPAPAPPVAPPAPNWPINDKPTSATVVWDSHGLRIDAANSSLAQILQAVSTDTGAKVEGLHADQRIFGTYGPGPARDVLSQLLDGTGYNVMMIGDQGEGTPRQIVLSAQPTGPAPVNAGRSMNSDDDYEADQQQPQPLEQPAFRGGFQPPEPPGAPPRTPQQIMQELQQQQQQEQNNRQR